MLCSLCKKGHTRENSHIIPRMVYRWLKDVSVTGHLRFTANPNRRSQDGPKIKLLCPECEDLFNRWETEFARKLFNPLHRENTENLEFEHEGWLLRFAVSVSWRCLYHLMQREPDTPVPFEQHKAFEEALETWRLFLLGEIADIGNFHQHLIILDRATETSGIENGFDLNIYLLRSVEYNTIHSPTETYIFSKLGRSLFVGSIFHNVHPYNWKGTTIDESGKFSYPVDHEVSSCVFKFFETSIAEMRAARSQISSSQIDKMNESFFKKYGAYPP